MEHLAVIIPTLNEAHWINGVLSDLTVQTSQPSMTVVVDGGSHDATRQQVKRFPKVRWIVCKPSIAGQRNLGASKTKAEWLVFLDADVRIPPDCLQQLESFANKTKADIVIPTYVLSKSAHPAARSLFAFLNSALWLAQWSPLPAGAGPCLMMSRACFDAVGGFDTRLRILEDLTIVRTAGQHGYKVRMAPTQVLASDRRFTGVGVWTTTWLYLKVSLLFVCNRHTMASLHHYPLGHHQSRSTS